MIITIVGNLRNNTTFMRIDSSNDGKGKRMIFEVKSLNMPGSDAFEIGDEQTHTLIEFFKSLENK